MRRLVPREYRLRGGGAGYSYCNSLCYTPTVSIMTNMPEIEWLVIPGTASFLKEFFDVQMVVQNLAPAGFTISQGTASLQVPSGLSLAPTATPQQQTQSVPDIGGGESQTINWILRGDTEGSYSITADYSGLLQPFGAAVSIEAEAATPLKVWGASALTMTIDADATATADYPYEVRVGLTNVSDIPIYNPIIALSQSGGTGYIFQPQQQLSYSTDVILPGQSFYTPYYILIPQVSGTLDLSRAFVQQTGGNVDIASTVVTHPDIDPAATAPTATATPLIHAVGLQWQPVTGATSYRIFSTPTALTPFATSPIEEVPSTQLQYVANGVDPSSTNWYAVSAVISGTATLESPIVQAHSSDSQEEPTVAPVFPKNGCTSGMSVTVYFSDTFEELTSYTYTVGSNAPVTRPLSGFDASGTFDIPASEISDSGTQVSITGTDALGPGPTVTQSVCGYVALGDSYSAGEGAGAYDYSESTLGALINHVTSGPIWGGDPRCHRSTNSYAALLANDYFAGNVDLRACSGAVMANVASIDGSPYIAQYSDEKDPPQINALSANTSFVTISIGGNDAGFANIFAYCLEYHDDCVSHFAGTIDLNSIETKLVSLYEQIKEDAPNATIVVVGYPQILPDAEAGDNYSCWDFLQTPIGNLGLDAASITWLRSLYDEGDKMIQAAAAEAGVNYANVEYAFNGHLSCSAEPAANGITWAFPEGYGSLGGLTPANYLVQTAHPNALGYSLEEPIIAKFIGAGNPGSTSVGPPDWAQGTTEVGTAILTGSLGVAGQSALGISTGGSFTVSSGGFAPGASVSLSVHSTPIQLGSFTADANGNVTATATLPPDLPPGTHTFVLTGPTTSGDTLIADTSSWVGAQPQPVTHLMAEPSDGQIVLSWEPPTDTGGLPLEGYNISVQPGNLQVTAMPGATTATLTGLTDGVSYTSSVSATTGWGSSDAVSVSSAPTSAPQALMIATQWLASATAGTAYPTATLAASGGVTPETWSVTAGALPAGLTLDATTGALSGTPTTAGTYDFTVGLATDSEQTPATVTQPLEIVVAPAATSTDLSASVPTVAAGGSVTYTATVDAPVLPTGDVDFTDNNTAVPSCQGVALSATVPHTATCTLTYDTAGDHSVTATYDGDTSTSTSTSTSATVTVEPATSPLNITTTSMPSANAGTAYPTATLAASGGVTPETWSVTAGALPAGLALDATTGALSGTPTTAGTYDFTVGRPTRRPPR